MHPLQLSLQAVSVWSVEWEVQWNASGFLPLLFNPSTAVTYDAPIVNLVEPVLLFSKLNKMFFGYFDPEHIFLDNENKYFSGWVYRYFGQKVTTELNQQMNQMLLGSFPLVFEPMTAVTYDAQITNLTPGYHQCFCFQN